MEETRTEKRNAWQDFLNKGNYAKQKQSMFKSPDTVLFMFTNVIAF